MAEVTVQSNLVKQLCDKAIKEEGEKDRVPSQRTQQKKISKLKCISKLASLADEITINDSDILLLDINVEGE